jgi:hypothetical protein
MGAVRFLLVCSVSAFVFLVQPSAAVAQTSCLDTAASAVDAIAALQHFTFTDADVVDRDDVRKDIDSAIRSLQANVVGDPSRLSVLCARFERLTPNSSSEAVVTGADCVFVDSLTCEGETLFGNYQDAVEALREGAIPRILNRAKIDSVTQIIQQVFASVEDLVRLAISRAQESITPGSDSPAIVDALQNQQIAAGQATTCFDGTVLRACGDAVGSFFDAWLNGIIEIIL